MPNCCKGFLKNLIRRKPLEVKNVEDTRLKRCLSTFDLTALGVGSTLGLGVYVLASQVALTAGPAVVLSFVIAAVASVFAGLCYAEFAARVPKAGSAYVYSYTTVGEFIAFVIGWNLILEYVIGTASVARGFSGYVDTLLNGTIGAHEKQWLPTNVEGISEYFDLFSFAMTMILAVLLCFGIKESTTFTAAFTGINLYVVSFVVICGLFKINHFRNWNLPPHIDKTGKLDKGGFFPYGFSGMIAGASRCFYGFVGFDAIASTGEEAKDPQRSMPISICVSLVLILMCYFGVAAVATLMWPYYDQNGEAPLAYVFAQVGWSTAYYVIAVGAITSLTTALLGSLLPLPRVLFAMASDGLLPDLFKSVNKWTNTPVYGTLFSGLFAGTMAAMFTTGQLMDMMSIGTLLAYTLVSLSVLILRYQEDYLQVGGELPPEPSTPIDSEDGEPVDGVESYSYNSTTELSSSLVLTVFNIKGPTKPNRISALISNVLIVIICINIVVFCCIIHFFADELASGNTAVACCAIGFAASLILFIQLLHRQPQTMLILPFKVPCLPYFPVLSIFFNFYLMLNLSRPTWIRFAVWMIIGFLLYFGYGYFLSSGYMTEEEKEKERRMKKRLIEKNVETDPRIIE